MKRFKNNSIFSLLFKFAWNARASYRESGTLFFPPLISIIQSACSWNPSSGRVPDWLQSSTACAVCRPL